MIEIRKEKAGDEEAIRLVNMEAFGQPQESEIVDALRENCSRLLSLVALDGEDIVGHILFSPVMLSGVEGMGLAPMAVRPKYQREGVGTRLVRAGLTDLEGQGCPFVAVVGHPEYYPRFGFERASTHDIRCKWDVPDEAFMVLVLDAGAMKGVSGMASYREEFG